jgi:hypothetical protein
MGRIKAVTEDLSKMTRALYNYTMKEWRTIDEFGGKLTDAAMDRLVEKLPGLPIFLNFDYSKLIGRVHFAEGNQAGLDLDDAHTDLHGRDIFEAKLGYCGRVMVQHTGEDGQVWIDHFEPYAVCLIPKPGL